MHDSPSFIFLFHSILRILHLLKANNMPVLQQPEIYLANVAELLDDNGKIMREDTVQFLQSAIDAFVELSKKH